MNLILFTILYITEEDQIKNSKNPYVKWYSDND